MNRGTKAWEAVLDECFQKGKEILRLEVERVFKKHPRLKWFNAYMGIASFLNAKGETVYSDSYPGLPTLAMDVLELEEEMRECVGSYSVTWVNKDGKAVEEKRND